MKTPVKYQNAAAITDNKGNKVTNMKSQKSIFVSLFFFLMTSAVVIAIGTEVGQLYEQNIPTSFVDPPSIILNGDEEITTSQRLTVSASATHSLTCPASYYWYANEGSLVKQEDPHVVLWTPPDNFSGSKYFTLYCTIGDGKGLISKASFEVLVTNDAGTPGNDVTIPKMNNVYTFLPNPNFSTSTSAFIVGRPVEVRWEATDTQTPDNELNIELKLPDATNQEITGTVVPNTGNYIWTPQETSSDLNIWVRATDKAGNHSEWVASNTFNVVPANTVELPTATYLENPGSVTCQSTIDLKWRKILDTENNLNVNYYQLQYSTDSSFSNPTYINHNDNSDPGNLYALNTCTVSALQDNNRYYFRVRGVNDGGNGPWSNSWGVLINIESQPVFDIGFQEPANSAQGVHKRPVLRWDANDADGDELDYCVLLGADPTNLIPIRPFGVVGYEDRKVLDFNTDYPESLLPDTTYYWKIKVREVGRGVDYYGGEYITSPLWTFRTVASGSDLNISNVELVGEVKPNSTVLFKMTVHNNGSDTAQNVTIDGSYIKNGTESPFRTCRGYMSGDLAAGQSEIIDVEVVFHPTLIEYNGIVYDNILVLGDSQVKLFFHWEDPQDINLDNNQYIKTIHYEDTGAPEIDYFDLREHGSMYENNGVEFWARMGHDLIIPVRAHDDIKIARFVIQRRFHITDNWETIHDQTNDSAQLYIQQPDSQYNSSDSYIWPVPDTVETTDDAQFRIELHDDNGNMAERISEPFSIVSGQIDASIDPRGFAFKVNENIIYDININSGNTITELNVTLLHGSHSESIHSESNAAGISIFNPYEWAIPDNNFFVSTYCYLQLRLVDDKGNISIVRSSQFRIDPNTSIPAPFNQAVTIYNDEFSFPVDALSKQESRDIKFLKIDENNLVHLVLRHSYEYCRDTAAGNGEDTHIYENKHYYISYNSDTSIVTSQIPVGNKETDVVALEIIDGVPYILLKDTQSQVLYVSNKSGSTFTAPIVIENENVPGLAGPPVLKSSDSEYSDHVTAREKYVYLNGYLWELDIFTSRIYRRSFTNGVMGTRGYSNITNNQSLESYGVKPLVSGDIIYYIATGSSKFVKLDTSTGVVQSFDMPFSTSALNATYWNKCNAALGVVNGRVFVFGNGRVYEFANNSLVEAGSISYTFNGETIDYSGDNWSAVGFIRVVNADGALYLIMDGQFYGIPKPVWTNYEILEFNDSDYSFRKNVAASTNGSISNGSIDGRLVSENPDLLYLENNKVLVVFAGDIDNGSDVNVYRVVLKILDLGTGAVTFVGHLPLKASRNISLLKEGGSIYVLAQNKETGNAESYKITLTNLDAAPKLVDNPQLEIHNSQLFATWAGGIPYNGTWNNAGNCLNMYLNKRNKARQIYPSIGSIFNISDDFLGNWTTIGAGHLSASIGKIFSLNADLTVNSLVYNGTDGNVCRFKPFGSIYVGALTTYNGPDPYNAILLKSDYSISQLSALPQNSKFATYDNTILCGGYKDYGAYISKIDLDTGQRYNVVLGSPDMGGPYRIIDMNADKYVAVGWGIYVAVGDFSADIVAPTVTITNQQASVQNGRQFTLTWNSVDNNDQLEKIEIYKEVNGNRSQLATFTDTSTTSYAYSINESNATEITFTVYVFDTDGNVGEGSLTLPIDANLEDLTAFTLDKTTVLQGETVTFNWDAVGVDYTTEYKVSSRLTGTIQWQHLFQVVGFMSKQVMVTVAPGTYDFKIEAGIDSIELAGALTVNCDMPAFDYPKFNVGNNGYYSESNQVTLNWDIQPFTNRNLVIYDVYINPNATGYSKVTTTSNLNYLFNISAGTTSLSWKITAVYQGSQYESTEQTTSLTPLSSPAVSRLELRDNNTDNPKVYLEFTPITGITQYIVTRKATSGAFLELATISTGNYTDNTVTYGESYEYGVLAKIGDLKGFKGICQSIQVLARPVNAVTILNENFVVIDGLSLSLNYQPDSGDAYEKYQILMGTDQNNMPQFTVTTQRSVQFTGLEYETTYYAQVMAVDANSNVTATSDIFVFFTQDEPVELPDAPTELTCAMAPDNKVEIRWSDNSDNELGFIIERKDGPTSTYRQIHVTDRSYYFDSNAIQINNTYFYRVRSYNSAGYSSFSNESHIITYSLAVTSPNGGEAWDIDETKAITWTGNGNGNVSILLSRDNGSSWETLYQSTPNDGSEPWSVSGADSELCLIKIIEADGGLFDVSDDVFSIGVTTGLEVLSPNGGETWEAGSTQTITWNSTGSVGNVKIEYSTAGMAGTFVSIIDSVENSGSYQWTVPNVDSDQCVIRISETDGSPIDTSDGLFTIQPALESVISVTAPNGGEKWRRGSTQTISWNHENISGNVSVQLYKGESQAADLGSVDIDAGSLSWSISTDLVVGNDYRIRVFQDNEEDFSDSYFIISTATHPDFNNDGLTDLLWRHNTTGENGTWLMNGTIRTDIIFLNTLNPDWESAGTADFNGDGKTDIMWRHKTTGENGVWMMDGTVRTEIIFLPTLSDINWKCGGLADFNGDGKTDIMWRNQSTGQNGVWMMDGTVRTEVVFLPSLSQTDWKCRGLGDFNGDGKPDIFWRHLVTGENAVWFMDGVVRTGNEYLNSLTDMDWICGGLGDFNNDGKPDIFWRHQVTGQNGVWFMDGTTRTYIEFLNTLSDTAWELGN